MLELVSFSELCPLTYFTLDLSITEELLNGVLIEVVWWGIIRYYDKKYPLNFCAVVWYCILWTFLLHSIVGIAEDTETDSGQSIT